MVHNVMLSALMGTSIVSLRKGYQGAGRMLFPMGSKGKIKKGAERLNLVREQGAGK